MPAATSPLATATTSSLNWLALTSAQAPETPEGPAGRRSTTACGCSAARRKTTSARFAVAGICARAGMLYSRTVSLQPVSLLGSTSLGRLPLLHASPRGERRTRPRGRTGPRGRRRGRPDLPGAPAPVPRLPRPRPGYLRRPVRGGGGGHVRPAAHRQAVRRGQGVLT